jgi:hypothetical protein
VLQHCSTGSCVELEVDPPGGPSAGPCRLLVQGLSYNGVGAMASCLMLDALKLELVVS